MLEELGYTPILKDNGIYYGFSNVKKYDKDIGGSFEHYFTETLIKFNKEGEYIKETYKNGNTWELERTEFITEAEDKAIHKKIEELKNEKDFSFTKLS